MSLFLKNEKNSCFIEDALMMSFQSSSQDEKARKENRPSPHFLTLSGTIQMKKNLARTSRSRESTQPQKVEHYSGRSRLDQFSPSTGQRTTILTDKVSCRNCVQLCADRMHPQSDVSKRRKAKHLGLEATRNKAGLYWLRHQSSWH